MTQNPLRPLFKTEDGKLVTSRELRLADPDIAESLDRAFAEIFPEDPEFRNKEQRR
jgi:hypothetical protein